MAQPSFCQQCGTRLPGGVNVCPSCGAPVGGGSGPTRRTPDERKELLARTVANQVPVGWRVESQSDYQAVMVRGRPVNHVLHLILTIITCSWWGLVWISLVFFGGERRLITNVDEWGNILTSRLDSRRAKVIAAVALSIVGGFWLLVLVVVIAGIEDGTTSAAPTYVPYSGETPVPTPTPIPVERVDAEAILSDYNSNEAAADAQWRGRWLLVSV